MPKTTITIHYDYWYEHNGSFTYSAKIIQAVEALEYDLANNPYFVGRYSKSLNLYCRTILKGRFLIYFDVNEKEKVLRLFILEALNKNL